MKKAVAFVSVLAAMCLLLCGCKSVFSDEYVSVKEHNEPYALQETSVEETQTQQPEMKSASTYFAMKSILRTFISTGVEHGQFKLENYDGVVGRDLEQVTEFFTQEDPVGAYAIDYMSYEKERVDNYWLIRVDAVYRRSVSEIESIQSIRGNERADELVLAALSRLDTALTLRISGYEQEDFSQSVTNMALQRPDLIADLPQTTYAIYPQEGNVRVVELHFTYPYEKDTMRTRVNEANTVLNSISGYTRYAQDDQSKLTLTYSFLSGRFSYTVSREESSAYLALCTGTVDSASMSGVFGYLCRRSGLDCLTVSGFKGEQQYYWNIISIDGVYYHIDVLSDILDGRADAALRLDREMQGFRWDAQTYPACDGMNSSNDTQTG